MPAVQYYRYLFLSLGFCLLPCICSGRSGNYYFVNITEKDGFNPNVITCMLQDSRGYIWFGTKEGLNRYDGYRIERFTNRYDRENTLTDNFVYGLAEDRSGRIWIGTVGGGLNCYDPVKKRFTSMLHKEGDRNSIAQNKLGRLYRDSKDRLWMGYAAAFQHSGIRSLEFT